MSDPENNVPEPSPKAEIWEEVLSWSKTIVFAVVFALLVNNFIIVNAYVPTASMEETIMSNDRVVAYRLSYLLSEPKRYDIVVFRFPDDESTLFVKRVIGLPGDTIEIRGGHVYLNGSDTPLKDDFTYGITKDEAQTFVVPENCYFMLGDNRNNSRDSREWDNTYVEKKKILGKVIFRYFPKFKIYRG